VLLSLAFVATATKTVPSGSCAKTSDSASRALWARPSWPASNSSTAAVAADPPPLALVDVKLLNASAKDALTEETVVLLVDVRTSMLVLLVE